MSKLCVKDHTGHSHEFDGSVTFYVSKGGTLFIHDLSGGVDENVVAAFNGNWCFTYT